MLESVPTEAAGFLSEVLTSRLSGIGETRDTAKARDNMGGGGQEKRFTGVTPGFSLRLCHLLPVGPREHQVTSLNLFSFLTGGVRPCSLKLPSILNAFSTS